MLGGNYNETWGIYTKATQSKINDNILINLHDELAPLKSFKDEGVKFKGGGIQEFVDPYEYSTRCI